MELKAVGGAGESGESEVVNPFNGIESQLLRTAP